MSRTLVAICLVLAVASVSFAGSQGVIRPGTTMIGNWENGTDLEGWSVDPEGTAAIKIKAGIGNTVGDHSLKVGYNGGYWQLDYTFAQVPTFGAGCKLSFDFTCYEADYIGSGWEDFDEKIKIHGTNATYMELTPTVVYDDGSSSGHDWGGWYAGDIKRTYTTDLSSYTPGEAATDLTITIAGQGRPCPSFYIDNVEFCPEPATMALLGLGGLALIRRKK